MKKEVITSAETLDAAIKKACNELGVTREEVSIEIINMPKKGFLNIGKVEAKIKAKLDIEEKKTENKLEIAKNYLESILKHMGLEDIDIDVNEKSDKKAILTLRGDDLKLIIGWRGETLNALQRLCSVVANKTKGDYYNIILDVGNYRSEREKSLKELGLKISKTVLKNKKCISLEPMNAYERKILHEVIQEVDGVGSRSVGKEPNRYITIFFINSATDKTTINN